jgi:superfamily II DNA/RNA helicase
LQATSGQASAADSARGAKLDATRRRNKSAVALVTGRTKEDARQRAFDGFNSPLLPEILVCTQVGAEGIDLHRYCRFVVHYDLPWNPAIIEQRTGRVDRIGSKTFRERERDQTSLLDIAVPFLAGTYDERIFEEVRVRAQTFEVLTGGTVSAEATSTKGAARPVKTNGNDDETTDVRLVSLMSNAVGNDADEELAANGGENGWDGRAPFETGLAVLPEEMVEDLRVRWGV